MTYLVKVQHFSGYELKCKCGCGLLDCNNMFIEKLDVFRDLSRSRLQVTSGCRCKKHNKDVGGKQNSLHIAEGRACSAIDIIPLDRGLYEIYTLVSRLELFNEVILYEKLKFIHLGQDPNQKENFYSIRN